MKDQIGSFFYFPSLNFQRAAGGYGGIIVNNRDVIPLPFAVPDGDVTLFIGDWYTKSHKVSTTGIWLTACGKYELLDSVSMVGQYLCENRN